MLGCASDDGWVTIFWDDATKNKYRVGSDGLFDLIFADPVRQAELLPPQLHPGDQVVLREGIPTEVSRERSARARSVPPAPSSGR